MCVCEVEECKKKWKYFRDKYCILGKGERRGPKKVERRVAERLGGNTWESCHLWNLRYKRGLLLPTWTTMSMRQK